MRYLILRHSQIGFGKNTAVASVMLVSGYDEYRNRIYRVTATMVTAKGLGTGKEKSKDYSSRERAMTAYRSTVQKAAQAVQKTTGDFYIKTFK